MQAHFPAVTGLCLFDVRQSEMKIAATYSDRSLFVWDVKGTKVAKYRSFHYHSGCIWGLEVRGKNKKKKKKTLFLKTLICVLVVL